MYRPLSILFSMGGLGIAHAPCLGLLRTNAKSTPLVTCLACRNRTICITCAKNALSDILPFMRLHAWQLLLMLSHGSPQNRHGVNSTGSTLGGTVSILHLDTCYTAVVVELDHVLFIHLE